LSARWRRSKKRSKRFNILRAFGKPKEEDTQVSRIKNPRIKTKTYPGRCKSLKLYTKRKWREPEPLIDVLEEKNEIIVVAEFAGFTSENLKINVKNQQLTLSAQALGRKYHKSLNLPKRVNPNNIFAQHKNGVLEIRLKKANEEKPIDRLAG